MLSTKILGPLVVGALLLAACGGGDSSGGGSGSKRLSSGDFAFEIDLLSARVTNGEVRRGGQIQSAPSGEEWWAFELRIKNVSASSMQSANAPDVGVACGDEAAADARTLDDPGFIMGSAPYSSGMLGNGASNTGVIPLAVPTDASECRLIVRMDPLHDPGEPEIVEFAFNASE